MFHCLGMLLALLLAGPPPGAAQTSAATPPEWRILQPGVEYTRLKLDSPSRAKSVDLHVVRIDPRVARLRAVLASESDGQKRTTRRWAEEHDLAVATNLGMFNLENHAEHTGFLRHGKHINSARWVKTYQSVLAFDPLDEKWPPAVVLDLDAPGAKERLDGYGTVVQNLRLIKGPGQSVWKDNRRQWSEMLLADDDQGRILLLFSRTPVSMPELNRMLLASPLRIQRAMHLEGGPEASLSIHAGGVDLDLCGSYETGFLENDGNLEQWPIPNVLGVERVRPAESPSAPDPSPKESPPGS